MKDITPQILAICYNIFITWLTATLALLTYSFRSNKEEFSLVCWYRTNTNRFAVGAVMIVAISILIVVEPSAVEILKEVLGFDVQASKIALGIGIGLSLIAGVSGNNGNKN